MNNNPKKYLCAALAVAAVVSASAPAGTSLKSMTYALSGASTPSAAGSQTGDTPERDFAVVKKAAVSGAPLDEPGLILPRSYRTETTPIRMQGSYNTCWAFSGLGSLEAFLSHEGRGEYDFSEQHLSWWSTAAYNSGGIGWQTPGLSYGGYSMICSGYLTSWEGPKLEEDIPYLTSGNNEPPENMEGSTKPVGVTGIIYVPNDMDSIKTAIYKYGGVSTSFQNGSGYGPEKRNYYQNEDVSMFTGHAVTVIGWDDDYPRESFREGAQPEHDGAWFAKNSWGPNKGDDGYIWISYDDRYVFRADIWGTNIAFNSVRTMTGNDHLYQNERFGSTYSTSVKDGKRELEKVTYANVFDFSSEYPSLQEVIFETTEQGAQYTVWYIPVEDDKPIQDKSKWKQLASGIVEYAGYNKADIYGAMRLDGKAAIGVTIDNTATDNGGATFGVDEWLSNANNEYIFVPDSKYGDSFVITDSHVYDLMEIYAANNDGIGATLVIKAVASSSVLGDADDDIAIHADDAMLVLRETIGFTALTDEQAERCDVNFDGVLSADDALMILRRSLGLINDF